MMSKVYCIYPYDKTTKFLSSLASALSNIYGDNYIQLNIDVNNYDHENCLKKLNSLTNNELIFFLGHGGGDYLSGAAGDMSETFVSEDFASEYPEMVFKREEFINDNNLDVFKKNRVFCLSCYSGESLAKNAIVKGATAFLGFGDIPTTEEEFNRLHLKASNEDLERFQAELNTVLMDSIAFSVGRKQTFKELLSTLKLFINRKASDIILKDKKYPGRRIIADGFYYVKKGLILCGDADSLTY